MTGVTPGNCIAGAEVEEEDSSGLWLEVTKVAMVYCVTMPGMVIILAGHGNWTLNLFLLHQYIWWQGGSRKKVAKRKKFAKKYHYFSLRLNMLCFQLNMSY